MQDPYSIASPSQLRHALRTPLNHIIGYSEMILEDVRDAVTPGSSNAVIPSLEAIVFNARELVRFVQNAFPAAKPELSSSDVRDLQNWLKPHLLDLMGDVGVLRDIAPHHHDDIQRIQKATERLLAFSNGIPEALQEGAAIPEQAGVDRAHGSRGYLLVVDDSSQNRDILRRSLERNGYQIDVAENGAAALERIRAAKFDLILLDVLMPVMDGYALLRELKMSDQFSDVPVIMISALDESSAVVRCVQMGAEDYIMKPFDPVLVRTRVGAALARSRAVAQLSRIRVEAQALIASVESLDSRQIAERLDKLLRETEAVS